MNVDRGQQSEPDRSQTLLPSHPITALRVRLTSGMIWNVLAALSTQGTTLLTSVVLSNVAGIATFGRYAVIQNTLVAVTGLSSLAMAYTTTKYVSEFRSIDKNRTARLLHLCYVIAFTSGTLAAISLLWSATPLATHMLKDPALATAIRLGAAFVLFTTINSYQLGALSGFEAFRSLGIAAVISGVLTITISTIGLLLFGVNGAILGQAIGSACRYLIHRALLAIRCQQAGIAPKRGSLTADKQILSSFVLPTALSAYITLPSIWFANTLLFRHSNGASELALYTAALTLKTILLFLPNTITGVSLSVINNVKSTVLPRQYLTLYGYNILLVFGIVLVCTIPVMLFAQPLLRAFGRDFSAGRSILLLLALSALADGVTLGAYPLIQSQGRMWTSFWAIAFPRDTIFAALAFYSIPLRGALGLAQTQLAVSIIVAASTIVVCYCITRDVLRSSSEVSQFQTGTF